MGAKRGIGFEVHKLAQQDKPISLVGGPERKVLNLPEDRRIAAQVEDIGDFPVFVVDPEDFPVGLGFLRAYFDFHRDAFAVIGEESVRHLALARGPHSEKFFAMPVPAKAEAFEKKPDLGHFDVMLISGWFNLRLGRREGSARNNGEAEIPDATSVLPKNLYTGLTQEITFRFPKPQPHRVEIAEFFELPKPEFSIETFPIKNMFNDLGPP